MGHAWLDSLSEDWVSQPGSADASFAEAAPSPDPKLPKPQTPSRIPRLSPHTRKFHNPPGGSGNNANSGGSNSGNNASGNILGERSINERLAALRRTPSKLSQELSPNGRDCHACRSASASTTNSVVRKSFLRKSLSASQSKGQGGDTPEWKRRLVYGDLSYGEQKDLFTSAGTGLENMFKPPLAMSGGPSRDGPTGSSYHEHDSQLDVAVPSSPPPYHYQRDPSTVEIHVDEAPQNSGSARTRHTDAPADARGESGFGTHQEGCSHHSSNMNQTALSADGESRKVSGRSDIRNEDFSPIILERRQASDGATTFSPADLPPDELRKRLEMLRRNQMIVTGDANGGSTQNRTAPRHLEITQDHFRLDGFVNFQRGGRSGEGSFRNHVLSSALNDSSELNPEESLQASTPKQFPSVRVEQWDTSEHVPVDSPDFPRAPDPSPEKRRVPVHLSPDSPLKLFQPYDTFTNQTLLRRLSQMHEEAGDNSFSIAVDESRLQGDSPSRLLLPASHDGVEDHSSAYANRFGAGELDGYEFNDEFSHMTHDATGMDGDKENREPDEDSILPSHPPIFDLTHDSSPLETPELVVDRRRKSTTSHPSRRSGRASFPAYFDLSPPGGRRDLSGPEIKRPRTSPTKDPTPKRRRTLHRSDVSYGTEEFNSAADSAQLSHHQGRSGLGRFREDAYSSSHHGTAEFDGRQSVRPRTPTPNQRSSIQRERQSLAQMERSPGRSSRHSQPPLAHPVGATVETHRKPSIKTEDFINEANKIMAMIRSKAGLASGLTSVEESDEEKGQPSPELDGSFEESTQEPFSRPPSREGRPPLTRMSTKQEDPVLAEQLKKYEEASDMGDLIPSSVRSTRLAQEAISVTREQATAEWANSQSQTSEPHSDFVSDPPNIRISRNPDWQEQHSAHGPDDAVPSQDSARFNTHSTGVSIPTVSSGGSSRGSDARKTIMPESVCHLIPDQVGNMILDRQRNMWIRRKGSAESKESFIQSEISEDDPFADIPDLSVDVTREMQNLLLTRKREDALQNRDPSAAQISPTKPHRVGSLTRAALDAAVGSPINQYPDLGGREEFVEHEISVNEEGVKETRRLTISFSSPVASVIQDVAGINDMLPGDNMLDQETDSRDPPARGRRIVSVHKTTRSRSARSRSTSRGPARHLSFRGKSLMARPVSRIDERDEDSAGGHDQGHEPVSGMELSVLGDYSLANRDDSGGHGSLSFVVGTPVRAPTCPVPGADAAPIISQYVGTFSLSPLPDFTMHRAEETLALEASYVVDDHRLVTGDKSRRVMSMSMRELVEKLAEVEPFEPYWEDMRELELRGKGLSALQALDAYCGQLESLDVSKNMIRNLGGIPSSILHLRITDNQLSSLTAWNHLMNLQYVDVSNNGLTTLAAFKSLIHLRSLRADNNQITSLDGIKFHKGLQTLRARGNLIEQVDFDGSTLHQLTDLDLKNNQISHITNIDQLPSLSSLNLDSNQLTSFSVDAVQPVTALRYLRLDDNNITTLNVRALPHLRLLHADRNALVHISGFSRARRIDSLSLREQHGTAPLDLPHLLSRAYEVRKLYLSGNLLESFSPRTDLLNLQLLELANCGLSALPDEVGLAMPNLRVLNLNMNALADLAPLRAVPRLKRLFAAGNRLADPARVVGTLGGMACLSVVDLRDNPLTQGFYAPVQVVVRQRKGGDRDQDKDDGVDGEEGAEQFALGDQDAERDARYCARLDMDTRVRRRLYETMVRKKCGRVKRLDGLVLGKGQGVGGGEEAGADMVWAAMAEKGLVKRRAPGQSESGKGEGGEKKVVAAAADRSGRWPAEDSFA